MAAAPPPPPVDEYERKYMEGASALARSRLVNSWWFNAIFGGMTLFLLGVGVMALPHTIIPLLFTPLTALLWLCVMVLRVTVTWSHVHIQFGLLGPKIPIGAIRGVEIERYDWSRYGGWGIRLDPNGGVAYSVPGKGGRGVRITYAKGPMGLERSVFASTDRPEELVEAIERARAGRPRVATYREAAGPRIVDEEFAEVPSERDAGNAKRSARER